MANFTCKHCKSSFAAAPSSKKIFCTKACYSAGQIVKSPHTCVGCSVKYMAHPARCSKYCSRACFRADRARRFKPKDITCRWCGIGFCISNYALTMKRYCSSACVSAKKKSSDSDKGKRKAKHNVGRKTHRRAGHDCAMCGSRFYAPKYLNRKFCRRECFYLSLLKSDNLVSVSCVVCACKFKVKPYRKSTAKYCGRICLGRDMYQENLASLTNEHKIGNKWRCGFRSDNAFRPGENSGEASLSWVPPIKLKCRNCKVQFERKPWQIKKCENHFCGRTCLESWQSKQSGKKSKHYVGGKQTYRGRNWPEQRKKAVERDRCTCQRCGDIVGDGISVHHKKPYRLFSSSQAANNLNNLVSLCQSCHMAIENKSWSPSLLAYKMSISRTV